MDALSPVSFATVTSMCSISNRCPGLYKGIEKRAINKSRLKGPGLYHLTFGSDPLLFFPICFHNHFSARFAPSAARQPHGNFLKNCSLETVYDLLLRLHTSSFDRYFCDQNKIACRPFVNLCRLRRSFS